MSVTTMKPSNPVDQIRHQLMAMTPEFKNALPSHIKPEKFQRVIMTVVQQQPDLIAADRRSLFASCLKCAADGLIPDGREAALVIFNTKEKWKDDQGIQREGWVKKVQYMPMLIGIQKRARNSGEIAGIITQVVYENDEFTQRPDDFETPISHRPPSLGADRGKPIGAYAMVKLKDGTIIPEVMDISEIEKVRAVSKAKDGVPWTVWWDQMARKTVFRRLSKWIPMDADTDTLLRRDDEMEGADETPSGVVTGMQLIHGGSGDAFEMASAGGTVIDQETGEITETKTEESKPDPAADLITAYAECETMTDIQATDKNPAVKSSLNKLSQADKDRVQAARAQRVKDIEGDA